MDMRTRIEKLEGRVGVTNAIPPLIQIDVMNCEKGSTDPGVPEIGIIPGKLNGQSGLTLLRGECESPTDFLKRCEAMHSEFYV